MARPCSNHSRSLVILGGILLCTLCIYVGSYLSLVTPNSPKADFRIGGTYADAVFTPLREVDQFLFPGRWDYMTPRRTHGGVI